MAGVKPGDVVYDLGCGDGRIVVTAAQKFGARGVGVDIDPRRIAEANANARRAGVEKQVTFKVGDLFEADIRDATVVTLYLLPDVNLRLKPKLLRDLKPGTRVVSHDFSMGDDWKPERTLRSATTGFTSGRSSDRGGAPRPLRANAPDTSPRNGDPGARRNGARYSSCSGPRSATRPR